jgi:outer membrane receptor protein involved in Fe transport
VKHAWSRFLAGLAVLIVCASVADVAEAQTGKLTGVVTDAQSGQPLEGAQVALQGTGLSALTSANGRFFLVNVPPSVYSVVVRRIGYQSVEVRNVVIQIDVTRTQDVALAPTIVVTEAITVVEDVEPLIQPGVTGSATNIRADEISALPVTNIAGVLALQQGFLEVPQNTDVISFTDNRRNPVTPVRIRGGRAGETLTLIDGIPINNFVFGGPAFDITNEAVEQLDYQRGGFEPQYGNALSGIINIATREGGTNLAGAVSYQTSAVGGALGSTPDELSNFDLYQGFLSGPVPGTRGALRFMLAGRYLNGADRVLEFDDDVASPSNPGTVPVNGLDLFPGWRAFGYDNVFDVTGKLTYYFRPTLKLSAMGVSYRRERLPFDFDWMLEGFDPLTAPGIGNLEDSLSITNGNLNLPTGLGDEQWVVQGSTAQRRDLYSLRLDHTLGRWAYKIAAGRFKQSRETCNFFQGVCLGNQFADVNFTGDQFVSSGITERHPAAGTDEFYGGEDLTTYSGRFDMQGQATDHHQVQFGAFYQRHDLSFTEFRNQGTNDVFVVPSFYQAKPWDAAAYVQDRIEYDFLTVKFGLRFDFGRAGGLFFADPRDPTNGTTAREVCNGEVPGIAAFSDGSLTGFAACASTRSLLDSAAALSQFDDFAESQTRTQFSPRIGLSFPLTEQSTVFFNFGRYSQNPLYNNIFQNTGIGTIAGYGEGASGICDADEIVPDTDQCHPIIFNDTYTVSFLGNTNLLIEKTTAYEIGFATELADNYALQVVAFSKDQFGLSGVREGGRTPTGSPIFDVGTTYGTAVYNYSVIVNQDFQTVRGFEVGLRRRLFNYWGFGLNYSFSQATTNAAAPDLQFQRTSEEGDPVNFQELRSEIDQPHSFNASLFFRVANEDPFGISALNTLVRNGSVTFTFQARSGLPYTPTLSFSGVGDEQLEQNSGRAPSTFTMNLLAEKSFTVANMRYGLFARVQNLLDTENCVQVFPTTGQCNAGTVDQSRLRQGNNTGPNTTSTYFNRAQYLGGRRSINFGARINF